MCFLQKQFDNVILVLEYEKSSIIPEDMCNKPCLGTMISRSTKYITWFCLYLSINIEHHQCMKLHKVDVNYSYSGECIMWYISLLVSWEVLPCFTEWYWLTCSQNIIDYEFIRFFPYFCIYIPGLMTTLTGIIKKTALFLLLLNIYISNISIPVQNLRLPSKKICDHMFSDPDYILYDFWIHIWFIFRFFLYVMSV